MSRRDRDGSELDDLDDPDDLDPVRHTCRGGWAGFDTDDRPTPCLVCRPHLRRSKEAL